MGQKYSKYPCPDPRLYLSAFRELYNIHSGTMVHFHLIETALTCSRACEKFACETVSQKSLDSARKFAHLLPSRNLPHSSTYQGLKITGQRPREDDTLVQTCGSKSLNPTSDIQLSVLPMPLESQRNPRSPLSLTLRVI